MYCYDRDESLSRGCLPYFRSGLKIQPNKILIPCDLQSALTSRLVRKCMVIKFEVTRVVSVKSN